MNINTPKHLEDAKFQISLMKGLVDSAPMYNERLGYINATGVLAVILNVGNKGIQADIKTGIVEYYANKEKYDKAGGIRVEVHFDNGVNPDHIHHSKKFDFLCTPETMESFNEAFKKKEARDEQNGT